MKQYLAQRVGLVPVTLFVVSLLTFVLAQLVPGDVGRTILGPYATNAQVHALDRRLGYDLPVLQRYWHWATGFVSGNWGVSPVLQVPIRPLVMDRLGNSLLLAATAFVIVVPISVTLGVVAGLREGSRTDRAISLVGLSLLGLPEFVGATVLIVIFGVMLAWFPVTAQAPPGSGLLTRLHYLVLPAIPLVFVLFGYISHIARSGTIETSNAPYLRTATLKGIPRRAVLTRHLLPNALLPTVTVIGFQVGYLIAGLTVIEELFNYPGLGQLLISSATNHDLPTLADITMLVAIIFLVANILADASYALLNPRIRARRAQ